MDIDNSGRGPDPVILRQRISVRSGQLPVTAVFLLHCPLDPGKINPVIFSGPGRPFLRQAFRNGGKRDGYLHGPAFILRAGRVNASADRNRRPESVNIITVQGISAVPVSGGQEEIPELSLIHI